MIKKYTLQKEADSAFKHIESLANGIENISFKNCVETAENYAIIYYRLLFIGVIFAFISWEIIMFIGFFSYKFTFQYLVSYEGSILLYLAKLFFLFTPIGILLGFFFLSRIPKKPTINELRIRFGILKVYVQEFEYRDTKDQLLKKTKEILLDEIFLENGNNHVAIKDIDPKELEVLTKDALLAYESNKYSISDKEIFKDSYVLIHSKSLFANQKEMIVRIMTILYIVKIIIPQKGFKNQLEMQVFFESIFKLEPSNFPSPLISELLPKSGRKYPHINKENLKKLIPYFSEMKFKNGLEEIKKQLKR